MKKIKELLKKIVFRYTSFGKPTYDFCIEPIQLVEIIKGIDSVIIPDKKTCLVEIGVARGLTTRFIAEHINTQNYKVDYYCIDTFSSFTQEDLNFEVKERGKNMEELRGFEYNDYKVWKNNFKEFSFINPIKDDCSNFDFSTLPLINFCFLDVDLYNPTKNVLNNIWNYMAKNSLIIIDDVSDNNCYDGAYQAFMEFVESRNLDYKIVGNKCGIIRKT